MKLTGRPTEDIGLSIFSGVDFPNLMLNGLEGEHRAGISFPIKTVYMRDLRRDVSWITSEIKSGNPFRVVPRWIWSFGRILVGSECFDIEQVKDPSPAVRQFDPYVKAFWEKTKWRLSGEFHRTKITAVSTKALTRFSSLLIVCQGNINRSVVAEHLLRARGFTGVRSAGLLPISGRRPSMHAERFLAERLQIDISSFRSRSVVRALKEIPDFDLVLCFEWGHAAELVRRFRNFSGKVFLLASVANSVGPLDIADPHGGDEATYLSCFQRIDKLIDQLVVVIGSTDDRTMSESASARE